MFPVFVELRLFLALKWTINPIINSNDTRIPGLSLCMKFTETNLTQNKIIVVKDIEMIKRIRPVIASVQ